MSLSWSQTYVGRLLQTKSVLQQIPPGSGTKIKKQPKEAQGTLLPARIVSTHGESEALRALRTLALAMLPV